MPINPTLGAQPSRMFTYLAWYAPTLHVRVRRQHIQWTIIAEHMGTRSPLQCTQKYFSQIAPKRPECTLAQDIGLVEALRRAMNTGATQSSQINWVEIAKDAAVRIRVCPPSLGRGLHPRGFPRGGVLHPKLPLTTRDGAATVPIPQAYVIASSDPPYARALTP